MLVYLGCIIMYVIAFGIGKFNVLCPMWVNIPEYISLIISGVIIVLNVLLWRGKKKNIILRILNIIISIIAIIIVNFSIYCNLFCNSITAIKIDYIKVKNRLEVVSYEDAKEDVDYAMKYLKKIHPALRKGVPKEIEKEYDNVIDSLKMDARINVETVQNAIALIYSKMEDGHTYISKGMITNARSFSNDNSSEFVKYSIDTENSMAILTLDSCIINKKYIDCVNKMFNDVKEQNIQNVIVDLRNNGGGNSGVVVEFFRYLDLDRYKCAVNKKRLGQFVVTSSNEIINEKYNDLLFRGNIYILTSSNTYSAAMTFTEEIQSNKLGIIIGETPSNPPNCYIDSVTFLTPNAGVILEISTQQRFAIDKNIKEGLIQSDIKCNADEALDKVKDIIKNNK